MPVFSLSHHASYQCRHSGACCTAGWTIPVETALQACLGASELPQPAGAGCRFFDHESRLCAVHRDLGESAMPWGCRHFPRRPLIDDRGVFVTLSHFCPTATAMLFEATAPLAIVEAPPAFPEDRPWEGLDARRQWPPLVNPGLMFELETYTRFEHFIVATLAREPRVEDGLQAIAGAVERLREWNQRRGAFSAWAEEAFAVAPAAPVRLPGAPRPAGALLLPQRRLGGIYDAVRRTVPAQHDPPPLHPDTERTWRAAVAPRWLDYAEPVRRFVAAKGFGSWTAYQGQGIRTLVAEMAVAELVAQAEAANLCARDARPFDDSVMREAIRAADWLLVHLVDRQPFVDWLGEVEHA